MNTTVISGRLVRNPGYNEVENEKGLHKIAKFVLAVRRNYSCLLYTSPSPPDTERSRMPSSA